MTIADKIQDQIEMINGYIHQAEVDLTGAAPSYVMTIDKLPEWHETVTVAVVRRSMLGDFMACYEDLEFHKVTAALSTLQDRWEEELLKPIAKDYTPHFQKQVEFFIRDIQFRIYGWLKDFQHELETERRYANMLALAVGVDIKVFDLGSDDFVVAKLLSTARWVSDFDAYHALVRRDKDRLLAEYIVQSDSWALVTYVEQASA